MVDYANFDFTPNEANTGVQKLYADNGGISEKDTFVKWFEKLRKDGVKRIEEEFTDLTKQMNNHKSTAEAFKKNPKLNRYHDIKCLDDTRIALQDGLEPDYIHANYVNGFKRNKAYILCQGPTPSTIIDFWRMIWQERMSTVVMKTRLVERKFPKCARYFPVRGDVNLKVGPFEIAMKCIDNRQLCCAVLFELTNKLTEKSRLVAHVYYGSWPDQGVPEDADSVRLFLNMVKVINLGLAIFYKCDLSVFPRGPPIVFHCSAGIGRSAVLVILDIITETMIHGSHVDVLDLVTSVRQERYHAVHTKIQLLFIYQYMLTLASLTRIKWLAKDESPKVNLPTVYVATTMK